MNSRHAAFRAVISSPREPAGAGPDPTLYPQSMPAPSFSHTADAVRGIPVLRLSGVLDAEACPSLRAALDAAIGRGAGRIVIDLAGLRYVASAGIALLVQVHKRMRTAGGDLQLAAAPDAVQEVLVVLNLSSLVPVQPSVEAAVLAPRMP